MAASEPPSPSGASQVATSRVSVCQVSGDRRSRITDPVLRAALASAGSEPGDSPFGERGAGDQVGPRRRRLFWDGMSQAMTSEAMETITSPEGSLSAIRLSRARTSRSVASVRST